MNCGQADNEKQALFRAWSVMWHSKHVKLPEVLTSKPTLITQLLCLSQAKLN